MLGQLGLALGAAHVLLHLLMPASFLLHEGGMLVAGVIAFAWNRTKSSGR